MACPLCAGAGAREVYRLLPAPVTCTSVFDSAEEARAVPSGCVELVACENCGFGYNRSFDPALAELGENYESSQGASAHFVRFAEGLASDWVARYSLQGKKILEVGCGEGNFLSAMLRAGASGGIGLDPLAPLDDAGPENPISFLRQTLDEAHESVDAAALVCRHTLEHVAFPREFIALVRRWAAYRPGRVVLFELPAAEFLREECAFWDVYYEHCNYFSAPVLIQAFARAGFDVLRCERVYDGQYLVIEAVAGQNCPGEAADVESELAQWAVFAERTRAAADGCRARFTLMGQASRPLAIWQGAAKTVGVLAACGDIDGLACAIDLNPGRHGRFLPGSGLPIQSPEYLVSLNPANVVLMNAVYVDEVQARLDELKVDARLWTINDLTSVDFELKGIR